VVVLFLIVAGVHLVGIAFRGHADAAIVWHRTPIVRLVDIDVVVF